MDIDIHKMDDAPGADVNAALFVSVTFFSEKRKTLPCLSSETYCPHFVVEGDGEYLGVRFVDGPELCFDRMAEALVLPMYEGVSYSKLKIGTRFSIMEGGNRVGEGTVTDILKYRPCGEP